MNSKNKRIIIGSTKTSILKKDIVYNGVLKPPGELLSFEKNKIGE